MTVKTITIHQSQTETMVAVEEEGRLIDLYVEPKEDQSIVGKIYAGRVRNVLPGMQAAFVDIGLDKNAYLYVEDVLTKEDLAQKKVKKTPLNIKDYVRVGQSLLVQIKKAPVDAKGARVTLDVTLPGRYLVLMPKNDHLAVSRRIDDPEEKHRLYEIIQGLKKDEKGVLARTAAEGVIREAIEEDHQRLCQLWQEIEGHYQDHEGSSLQVYKDVDFAKRSLRELVKQDVSEIVVSQKDLYDSLKDYVDEYVPMARGKLVYRPTSPAQSARLLGSLRKALNRKVWLKGGGYLIFDKTEALTVIDVNTGKYIGKKNLEETAYKMNMVAAKELARQIRLRNLAGIIIVDFIDMKKAAHRTALIAQMESLTADDVMQVQVMGMTSLGLMEMTRKKAKRSLSTILESDCPSCQGKGRIFSRDYMFRYIRAQLVHAAQTYQGKKVYVDLSPRLAHQLKERPDFFKDLEEDYQIGVHIKIRADLHDDFIGIHTEIE